MNFIPIIKSIGPISFISNTFLISALTKLILFFFIDIIISSIYKANIHKNLPL